MVRHGDCGPCERCLEAGGAVGDWLTRAFVSDVSEEGGPEFTSLRAMAARYFDQTQAHRVAELVRDTGKVGAGEKVVVYRARLPR